MSGRRFKQEHAVSDDGWSDWIHPLPGYRMACCDCGLVHELELRIDANRKLNFRVRRDARSTGQMRRHMSNRKNQG